MIRLIGKSANIKLNGYVSMFYHHFSLPVQKYKELLLSPWHWCGHGSHFIVLQRSFLSVIGKTLTDDLFLCEQVLF